MAPKGPNRALAEGKETRQNQPTKTFLDNDWLRKTRVGAQEWAAMKGGRRPYSPQPNRPLGCRRCPASLVARGRYSSPSSCDVKGAVWRQRNRLARARLASIVSPPKYPTDRIRILYIGGTGRTGSTLLTKMLDQYPEFFAAGELAFLWRFGLLNQGKCGCGLLLRECPIWKSVFDHAFGGSANVDAEEMLRLRRHFNSKHLPLMLTPKLRERLLKRSGEFPSTVERLYHGITAATGCQVIVDSSKEPHYSYILRTLPSLEVFFLHLVRDPRAIAYSWKENRKKESGLPYHALMERRGAMTSATYFDVSNIAAEVMWARHHDYYMFLRYEDFLAQPGKTVRMIGQLVGLDLDPSRVIKDGTQFWVHHTPRGVIPTASRKDPYPSERRSHGARTCHDKVSSR